MGNLKECLGNYFSNYFQIYKKVNNEEQKYFNPTKEGVIKTVENIKQTITPINNWEQLLDLNSEEGFYEETEELYIDNKIILPTVIPAQRLPYRERQIIDFNTFW